MKNDLLKMADLSKEDIIDILNLASQLKYERKNGIEHKLLAAVLFGALTHLGGQVLAVEQLHLVPQLFFVVKGVQLGPVGGKEPEFYKMFVQDPISSDAFRR